jgi:hypothetical protein
MRFLTWAGIGGGALRVVEPLVERVADPATLQASYALTDVLLIAGFIGFALPADRLGRFGCALGVSGLLLIRIGAIAALSLYPVGAALSLFGAAFLGWDILRRLAPSPIAAWLWIAALIVGLAALIPQIAMPAAFAAGTAFGLAFVIEGIALL